MGHFLFFVFVVASCLLWSAACTAAAARTHRPWLRRPKTVPGTKYGQAAQRHPPEYADLVPGTVLMGTALSLLILATLASEAASRRIGGTTEPPMLSFTQRAEAAGITLDVMPPPAVQLAGGQPYDTAAPRHREPFHVLDARSFLQGDL